MSLLEVKNLTHSYGDKLLYDNASFDLYNGEHMGLVGQNGTGKSTLVKSLIGEVIPDSGIIKWLPKIKIGHLDQYALMDASLTIMDYLKTAYNELFEIEEKLEELNKKLQNHHDEKMINQASKYQHHLINEDFYSLESHISKVAAGLGITAIGMDKKIEHLSGGQRAKIILAKLLLDNPNILLLDEPTNFLDKNHIDWLSKYLKTFKGAFIVISHDFEFLDSISNCIIDIEFKTITKYSGNYTAFLRQKGQKREEYVRRYENQKELIAKTEDYIARNKARASTAAMAKSRQKKLDKIEIIAPPSFVQKPNLKFSSVPLVSEFVLKTKDLEIGYYYPLLPKLNLIVKNGERVAITGFNGIGKSTLLKTLIGKLSSLSGSFKFSDNIVINYFEQDIAWDNDSLTPLQYISDCYPKMSQKDVRKALSQCAIKAEHANQSLSSLSGGEQSKVKLCRLTLKPCNLLILDEPTNHLDAEAKEAFSEALVAFSGTVILVSHEQSFYKPWADKVFDIEKIMVKK